MTLQQRHAARGPWSQPWLQPWFLVGFGFLALALSFSARAALGLVMPVWGVELGWSRSFVSGTGVVALIVVACVAPLAGRMIDRRGPRPVLGIGLVALAIGCLMIAATISPVVFMLAFGGISAIGFGMVGTNVVSTAVAQTARRNQGLAIGIATSGATAGQFVIVPLIAALLAYAGWRWSFVGLGLASLLLVPLLWALHTGGASAAGSKDDSMPRPGLLADAFWILKRPAFHALFWSFLICGYTSTGVIETHFLPYASFCGFAPLPGATAYGVLSAVNMAGMIAAGWLTDRMNRPLLLGSIYVLRALTFILLMNVGGSLETLMLFAVLFGAVDYATVPVTVSLAASHLGIRVTGLAMGMISAGHAIGGAAGAFLGGYLVDLQGHYDWVWLSSLAVAVLAGLTVLLLRDRPMIPALVSGGAA
jgi:MFS family permease